MMKIGFDAKRVFYNNTGLGNYSRNVIYSLSENYVKNQYILYTPSKRFTENISDKNHQKNIFIKTPRSDLYKLPVLNSYWRRKNVIQDLIKDDIDIYHGLSNELPHKISKSGIKSIITIHDLIFIRYPHLFSKIDRLIYMKKTIQGCSESDKIIAVSEQTKQDIMKFLNIKEDKIKVIYQGCNAIFQKTIPKKEQDQICKKYNLPSRFILSVGSIEERKNLLLILKSLRKLQNEQLVVIGNGGHYKEKCINYIHKHHLENRVIFLNNLTTQEIASIYQKSNIMIYPSIFEGFGIPILESLFSKTPVITSKEGCFKEVGGKYSIYIDPSSTEELIHAIEKINKEEDYRENMIKNGWKHAQNFTNEKVSCNLMKTYESLI